MKNRLAPILSLALSVGCAQAPDEVSRVTLGTFDVWLRGGGLAVARRDGTVLLESPAEAVGWRDASVEVKTAFGMYMFREQAPDWSRVAEVAVERFDEGRVVVRAGALTGTLEPAGDGVLRVTWRLVDDAGNRLAQRFRCAETDRFFGLGALVHGTEHRGEVIPSWISEQGVGKLRRANPYDGFPLKGDIHDTYLSVPFVASSRGFGVLLEDSRRAVWHLCPPEQSGEQGDRWTLEVWNNELRYLVIDGPDLRDVLRRLTAITGRPRQLPDWALAPWIDAVHGQDEVLAVAGKLRAERVPASAIWTEDWVGGEPKLGGYQPKYHWTPDATQYPDLEGLARKLHHRGFRFLGYFNPFIEKGRDQWDPAVKGGHAIRDDSGELLTFIGPLMAESTLPDLSRPATAAWVEGYLRKAAELGFDGWMADFAEWLPVEAKLADGSTGAEAHNLYPVLWQRLHRRLWDRLRPDGDYVFFVRSGWTGTGGIAPVVWAGDQQTEFGGLDGMASVVPLMVNAGMSGIPIMTHDIAGYSTYGEGVKPTDRELHYRWTELGAFSPIMRTHHGALGTNWSWDSDAATISHFRTYARLHTSLHPYRQALARQASKEGIPMVRHLVLHHADDPNVADIRDQYLLGPSLLVAPVLERGATGRKVYLPSIGANWCDFFTGERYSGAVSLSAAAPLERIPVFAPAGAIVPMLLTEVDTLDRASDKAVRDLDAAEEGGLAVRVFLGADGAFALAEGTSMTLLWTGPLGAPKALTVDGKSWPRCRSGETSNCWTASPGQLTAIVDSAKGFEVTGGGAFSFEVAGGTRARRYEVTFFF
jgi:alpha-glucosidase (family GH31 glycosyl hydrolase)